MIKSILQNTSGNFATNRFLQSLLVIFAGIWIWAAIDPPYRFEWFLENILTVLAVGVLAATYRRFPLSNASYGLIFIFTTLHTVGAHYTYSYVPLGYWVADAFDLSRNHYDRLVHFSFGLLLVYPFRETILRLVTRNTRLASVFALTLVFTYSASYEILEWIVVVIIDPETGVAYLGTQGDEFDGQKDMALAAGGALATLGIIHAFADAE